MNPTGGPSKQALLGGAAILAIGLAVFFAARQWSFSWGAGDSGFNVPGKLTMACGACGQTFTQRGGDYVDRLRANAANYLVECRHCGKKAARPATQCPACDRYYLAFGNDGQGTTKCPQCQAAGSRREVPGNETLVLPTPAGPSGRPDPNQLRK
jgi:hypothetical protein